MGPGGRRLDRGPSGGVHQVPVVLRAAPGGLRNQNGSRPVSPKPAGTKRNAEIWKRSAGDNTTMADVIPRLVVDSGSGGVSKVHRAVAEPDFVQQLEVQADTVGEEPRPA